MEDLSALGRGLTTAEVAHVLGKNRRWVHRAIANGVIKGHQLGERDFTVFESHLAAFIASSEVRVAGGAA